MLASQTAAPFLVPFPCADDPLARTTSLEHFDAAREIDYTFASLTWFEENREQIREAVAADMRRIAAATAWFTQQSLGEATPHGSERDSA